MRAQAEALTESCCGLQLSVAISYSGRADLAAAARAVARRVAAGELDPEQVWSMDGVDDALLPCAATTTAASLS
jgi:undecaprenyl pyrophosphate synthase